ncbi:MAG: Lrp/AsnC family transcriptional regulator [Rhizobiales bacterium]|nr:Lrp/AsnC family transcriptional regulator [Hyphomicrobiales bacterium]
MILTDSDTALINHLKVNARASVSELARKLGVSRTTAQDRLTRLEDRGVISGYTVRLGAGHREAGVSAYVMIVFEPRQAASIVKTLKTFSAIETLQSVSGKIDLMAQVTVETPEALDILLDKIGAIDGVVSTESALVLSKKLDRGLAA